MKISFLRIPFLIALIPAVAFSSVRHLPDLLVFVEKTISDTPNSVLEYAAKVAPISTLLAVFMIVLIRLTYRTHHRITLLTLAIPTIILAIKHTLERSANTVDTLEALAFFFASEGLIGVVYISYSLTRRGFFEVTQSLESLAMHAGLLAIDVNEPVKQRCTKLFCTGVLLCLTALFLLSPTNRFQENGV